MFGEWRFYCRRHATSVAQGLRTNIESAGEAVDKMIAMVRNARSVKLR